MRTTRDRIRHAVMFEAIALILVAPSGGAAFGVGMGDFGVVAGVCTMIAMLWNYLYNLGFDHALLRLRGGVEKTVRLRVAHAVLFEAGLLVALVPFIALYLRVGLWEAFVMDVALAAFYLVYAFAFNLAYDRVFPVPGVRRAT
jgi:uncharacterized membrane protein